MPWGRYCCLEPVSEQAGAASVLGEWFWLGRSVASVSASASGPRGLVEGPVVDGLPEMDLPGLGSAAPGVPGVEADEVVADERDGHEHGCRDEAGLSEEAAVDAEPLVAVGADETLDEGAPIEGEPQRVDCQAAVARWSPRSPAAARSSTGGLGVLGGSATGGENGELGEQVVVDPGEVEA